MPTRNISLTPEQDAFVDEIVRSGEYQNASEAVRDALRALKQRREQDALKLALLRKQVQAGLADLDAGNYDEVESSAVVAYLSKLGAASPGGVAKRSRSRKRRG